MSDFGVTESGFVIKSLQDILSDKFTRAREMFGDDVDLHSSSALRKILDICSAEDQELWKAMERAYYSNFISTASREALDLLGDDVGVSRRFFTSKSLEHEPEDSDHESEISRLPGFSLFILSFKSCSASNKAVAQHIPRRNLMNQKANLIRADLKTGKSATDPLKQLIPPVGAERRLA
jgi:hypothetical protein